MIAGQIVESVISWRFEHGELLPGHLGVVHGLAEGGRIAVHFSGHTGKLFNMLASQLRVKQGLAEDVIVCSVLSFYGRFPSVAVRAGDYGLIVGASSNPNAPDCVAVDFGTRNVCLDMRADEFLLAPAVVGRKGKTVTPCIR